MSTPSNAAASTPSVTTAAPALNRPAPVTAAPSHSASAAAPATAAAGAPPRARTRRAPRITTLQLRRIDPWTMLKISLIVAIVMFFVFMIAVALLYLLFNSLDVIQRINDGWATVTSPDATGTKDTLITPARVFGIAAVVGAINIVVLTAIATVFAFVYNASAGMAGGVELTLGERD